MEIIQSRDGTRIAFDQCGSGPPLILISGAACDRSTDASVADALARDFTVLNYDRRGRGDSTDTAPYAVEREIEDVDALVDAAGGSATLLGLSSGAVLAALATAERCATGVAGVDRLVMWEPPFSLDPAAQRRSEEYAERLQQLLDDDRLDDALALFMHHIGMPDDMVAEVRRSPHWQTGLSLAPTLAHDAAVLGDASIPEGRLAKIDATTLVLAGSRSPEPLRHAGSRTADAISGARFEILDGQDHNVAGDVIAPVVSAFAGR